jgi:hypothetical protein
VVKLAELSIPNGWDDLTPEWMTAALHRSHPDAVVGDVEWCCVTTAPTGARGSG